MATDEGKLIVSSPLLAVTLDESNGQISFNNADSVLLTDIKTTLEARIDEANKGKYKIKQASAPVRTLTILMIDSALYP